MIFQKIVIAEKHENKRVARLLSVPHIIVGIRRFHPPRKSRYRGNFSSEFLVGASKLRYPIGCDKLNGIIGLCYQFFMYVGFVKIVLMVAPDHSGSPE